MPNIRFVIATQHTEASFWSQAAMARTLKAWQPFDSYEVFIYYENKLGLPIVYNDAIRKSAENPAHLVFIHDDVQITDNYFRIRMREGLGQYDILGLTGSRVRLPNQFSWLLSAEGNRLATEQLSGAITCGNASVNRLNTYGDPGESIRLMDGMFIAAHSSTLTKHALYFDERFDFHFYDLDFSRTAEEKGLQIGTWAISALHESTGHLYTEGWQKNKQKYFDKWGS